MPKTANTRRSERIASRSKTPTAPASETERVQEFVYFPTSPVFELKRKDIPVVWRDDPNYSPTSPSYAPNEDDRYTWIPLPTINRKQLRAVPDPIYDGEVWPVQKDSKVLGDEILADMKAKSRRYTDFLKRHHAEFVQTVHLATPGLFVPQDDDDQDYYGCRSYKYLFLEMPNFTEVPKNNVEPRTMHPVSGVPNIDLVLDYMRFLHMGSKLAKFIASFHPDFLEELGFICNRASRLKILQIQRSDQEWDEYWIQYEQAREKFCVPENLHYTTEHVRYSVAELSSMKEM